MQEVASFGRWLKLRRIALELTQADLARLVDCAVVTIRKIEADERRPSAQIAERLARHLDFAPEERVAFMEAAQGTRSSLRLDPPTQTSASSAQRGYLPAPPTALIGREREVAAAVALLRRPDVRLLTLTGVGGAGKTRLAIQVAMELRPSFADGVWFVALAPITDPSLVIPAIAQALGIQEIKGQGLQATLQTALRDRQLLLVLDNFEQVLDAAVHVAALLEAAPPLTLLVTSRAPLHLAAEHQFAVPPLALPDSQAATVEQVRQSEAAALFITRAQAVKHDFAVTPSNAPVIAAMCARLDGLPLAIELAAMRCKAFPPAALLARLERRLDVLTGGARDLPTRQQTLRATIDWSYSLLAPAEQRLFARLSVFMGGWTLEAATAVCATGDDLDLDVMTGIEALLDQSLLREDATRMGMDGGPRFTMLETIREYAREQLEASGEADAVRQRHAAYYLELAETAAPALTGPEQRAWLARLAAEQDNLRAALAWFRERNEIEMGLRLGAVLHWFWVMRGAASEGRRWLETFLAQADQVQVADVVRANAQRVAGDLAALQDDTSAATPLLESSLQLYQAVGDQRGMASVLHQLGRSVSRQANQERGAALLDESLARYRELGDTRGMAEVLLSRSQVAAQWEGDFAWATRLVEESLGLFRAAGDLYGIAQALSVLGWWLHDQGDLARGAALLEEALGLARDLGDRQGIMESLGQLGVITYRRCDFERARLLFEEQLALAHELGSSFDRTFAIVHLGVTARYAGDLIEAQQLLAEGGDLVRHSAAPFKIALFRRYLADVLFDQGEVASAAQIYRESLGVFHNVGMKWDCAAGLEALAAVAGAQGHAVRAVRLWSSAAAIREAIGAPLPPVDRPRRDSMLAALRVALGTAAFEAAWCEGGALSLDQAIDEALME